MVVYNPPPLYFFVVADLKMDPLHAIPEANSLEHALSNHQSNALELDFFQTQAMI